MGVLAASLACPIALLCVAISLYDANRPKIVLENSKLFGQYLHTSEVPVDQYSPYHVDGSVVHEVRQRAMLPVAHHVCRQICQCIRRLSLSSHTAAPPRKGTRPCSKVATSSDFSIRLLVSVKPIIYIQRRNTAPTWQRKQLLLNLQRSAKMFTCV